MSSANKTVLALLVGALLLTGVVAIPTISWFGGYSSNTTDLLSIDDDGETGVVGVLTATGNIPVMLFGALVAILLIMAVEFPRGMEIDLFAERILILVFLGSTLASVLAFLRGFEIRGIQQLEILDLHLSPIYPEMKAAVLTGRLEYIVVGALAMFVLIGATYGYFEYRD